VKRAEFEFITDYLHHRVPVSHQKVTVIVSLVWHLIRLRFGATVPGTSSNEQILGQAGTSRAVT